MFMFGFIFKMCTDNDYDFKTDLMISKNKLRKERFGILSSFIDQFKYRGLPARHKNFQLPL